MLRIGLACALVFGLAGCKRSGCDKLAEMTVKCRSFQDAKIMTGQLESEVVGACDAAISSGNTAMRGRISCAERFDTCEEFLACTSGD